MRWLLLVFVLAFAPAASADPRLRTPVAELDAALTCDGIDGATRTPILLVPGTGATPEIQYAWNYQPALSELGIPWCAVELPDNTLADQQVDAEYLVRAIRVMHRRSSRRVAVVGHSQGGMLVRWPLRYWPSVRPLVSDVIGLAASNHGTSAVETLGACDEACPAAAWQQRPTSNLLRALNVPVETFPGIDYTQVFTDLDVLATPAGVDGTSPLDRGANVRLQDVCPGSLAEHVAVGTTDAATFALVLDAVAHDGPADPRRVDPAVCDQPALPGVRFDGAGAAIGAIPFIAAAATPVNLVGAEKVTGEPPLRAYVFRPQLRRGATRLRILATTRLTRVRVNGRTHRAAPPRHRWTIRVPRQRLRVRTTDADGRVVRQRLRR